MPDRIVESELNEVPNIDPTLLGVLEKAVEEARESLAQGRDVVPFTAVYVKGTAFIEKHDTPTAEECYDAAFRTVRGISGAQAYAFCYDGFIDSDAGQLDAIIAEGGVPGQLEGYAIAQVYKAEGDAVEFAGEPAYLGPAPNFMALTSTEPYHAPEPEPEAESESEAEPKADEGAEDEADAGESE